MSNPFTPDVVAHLRNAYVLSQNDEPTDLQIDEVISYCLMAVAKIGRSDRGRVCFDRVKEQWRELERMLQS